MWSIDTAEDKKHDDSEREVWESMAPSAWRESVASEGSIFTDTYEYTLHQINAAIKKERYDVVIEVGCGTSDIIGNIGGRQSEACTNIQRFGLDINEDFIAFSKKHYAHDNCEFMVQDATTMKKEWWDKLGLGTKYKKPLVICVNNTLNIMPPEIRGDVVAQMLAIAGDDGRCLVSYWNGRFFSHAVMNYYKKNKDLCGTFSTDKHVDWENRTLLTSSSYSTTWCIPSEVQKLLRSYDVDIDEITHEPDDKKTYDHINMQGLSIFAWFSSKCTSKAKGYYDSEDAQKFYKHVWGQETTHIGRYDKLTDHEKAVLPKSEQIVKAQENQEAEFIQLIKSKFPDHKVRVFDAGCGYGGLLRRIWEAGIMWRATGVDIAAKMCHHARLLNAELGCAEDITILEESYLDVSLADESVDLVTSMDALLHVGPEGQRKAVKEAARVLRPGGWMIFSDIMQQEVVDPVEMQPIYDRIHLSKLGTVSSYKDAMEASGFQKFEFLPASSNVSAHYGSVLEVLEKSENLSEIGLSDEYLTNMKAGLKVWRDLGDKNIVWGFMLAQKTGKIED